MHGLRAHSVPLFKFQRAIIDTAWQAEAMFGQSRFPAEVALTHRADLRHRDMALIHKEEGVFGEVFK